MHSFSILTVLFCTLLSVLASSTAYGKHKLTAYVVDWDIPKSVDWHHLDHLVYSFAEPNSKGELGAYTPSNLKSVVKYAHKHHVGVSIAVGGWSGSKYMSSLVSTSSKRASFANHIVSMVQKYNLDGVNLDWEYPNDPDGMSCNQRNSKDTANYLKFVEVLRKSLNHKFPKSHKMITLAVGTSVFYDEHRNRIKTLDKNWASHVDQFFIMAYDISGSWNSKTGPNAPLKASSHYDTSASQGVLAWAKAGIPKNKIVLGVPFYGMVIKTSQSITSSSRPYVNLASSPVIKGDKYDEKGRDPCAGSVASYSGEYQWRRIVADGITAGKNGWKGHWDSTAVTPFAFHKTGKKYLSYDNAKSLASKAKYAKDHGLGGVMIWSLEMDDSHRTLLKSLQHVRS